MDYIENMTPYADPRLTSFKAGGGQPASLLGRPPPVQPCTWPDTVYSTLSDPNASCLTLSGPAVACLTLSGPSVIWSIFNHFRVRAGCAECSTLSGPATGDRPPPIQLCLGRPSLAQTCPERPLPAQSCPGRPPPTQACPGRSPSANPDRLPSILR